jgi:uncharacterized protein YigA (DUF484 family)
VSDALQGITENDIAGYLANTPSFFERHAELLASIQLASPHGHRAVSLQERQMEMLRERIKGLERKAMDMLRAGQDNVELAARVHRWTLALFRETDDAQLAATLLHALQEEFSVPLVALRLWGVQAEHAERPWAAATSADVKTFAASLARPYCGPNAQYEAAGWLGEAPLAQSLAMIPLRGSGGPEACFGLLVLGSPDALRYQSDMGTEFLEQLGELASSAMGRLIASA